MADPHAKAKLQQVLRQLEHGDFQHKEPSSATSVTLGYDQTVPWDMAYHVAAQREAASLGIPTQTGCSHGRKRKAQLGVHQGPAGFTKNRNKAAGLVDAGSAHRLDPFSRTTAAHATQPQEASWRAAVSATPAAHNSLTPQNDLYGDPLSHSACVHPPQPPYPRRPPHTASPASVGRQQQGQWGAETEQVGGHARGASARVFKSPQGTVPGTVAADKGGPFTQHPSLTMPSGWGSSLSARLPEVPSLFWRTVAPDVHHEMLQRAFEQEYEQHSPLHAILATIKAKRALATGDALQQPGLGQAAAAAAAGAGAGAMSAAAGLPAGPGVPGSLPTERAGSAASHASSDGSSSFLTLGGKQRKDEARNERAAIAAGVMNEGGMLLPHIYRGPGAQARSRWYFATGDWEWRLCTVISSTPDGSTFAIRWVTQDQGKRGGIKSVSRFNILFESESERDLDAVKAVAVQHQQHAAQVSEHERNMNKLPLEDAPHMPPATATSILQRVGGFVLLPPPQQQSSPPRPTMQPHHTPRTDGTALTPQALDSSVQSGWANQQGATVSLEGTSHTPSKSGQVRTRRRAQSGGLFRSRALPGEEQVPAQEAGHIGNGSSSHMGGSSSTKPSSTDLFLELRSAALAHRLGLVPQMDVYEGAAAQAEAKGSGFGKHSGTTPPQLPELQFMGWRLDKREVWVKSINSAAPGYLKTALKEADEDYALVHNKLAYRHSFALATGMEVPEDPGLIDEQGRREMVAKVPAAAAAQESAGNEDLPGSVGDEDVSIQRMLSRRLSHAESWTRAHREISSLSAAAAAAARAAEGRPRSGSSLLHSHPALPGLRPLSPSPPSQAPLQASASLDIPDTAFYNKFVFRQRAAGIEAHALLARPSLLPAWQQCTMYLSEIMSRDLFGLTELPISRVFHLHPDPQQATRWRKYLDSRRGSGLPLLSSQTIVPSTSMSLVAFLNVQEGACMTEISDIQQRVCSQLALIIMDAAHALYDTAAAENALLAAKSRRLNWPPLGKTQGALGTKIDKRDFYRLASLLNVALYDTFYSLVMENIEAYVTGLTLYTSPSFVGPPLFSVVLSAVGDEIRLSPPLETFEKQLLGGITSVLEKVNSIPGFKVVSREQQTQYSAMLLPFDVIPELETPPVVTEEDPEMAKAFRRLQETLQHSFNMCANLVSSFSRHLGLLSMDSDMLRSKMMECREAMQDGDWETIMQKQREQGDEIINTLPIEAKLGLFMVDCRALQQRLAERAQGMVVTVLTTVQNDLEETTNMIIERLQPILDALSQPVTNLLELARVKDVAVTAPGVMQELRSAEQQLWQGEELMAKFKHQVPSELVERTWQAKRLPLLVDETVRTVNTNMMTQEARFLTQMKEEREVFAHEIEEVSRRTTNWSEVASEELAEQHLQSLQQQMEELTTMMEHAKQNNALEALAGWKITSYSQLHVLRKQLLPYLELWKLVRAFKEKYQAWMYGPLFAFDLEDLETSVPSWTKISGRLAKDLKGPPQAVASKYSNYMIDFEAHLPLIRALRTQGLRQRHWNRIKKDMPMLETMDKRQMTLHMMLQAGLSRHVAVLRELADLAARELVIEQSINSIEEQFNRMTISFAADNDSGIPNVYMLTNGNDIIKFVDDAQLRIKSLSASVYVDPHKESVIQWDEALSSIRAVLEGWLEVQAKWAHLAPLFGPSGLPGQLPLESRRFGDVTREWLKAVSGARAHGKLSELLRHSELPGLMVELSKGLEAVFKGVMEFLEEKRANFPRFFFLSNNEMVNVLVRSHDPVSVEPFLGRCFPGIKRLVVTKDYGVRIHALISPEGEQLKLRTPVDLVDMHTKRGIDVEMWMMTLERQMRIAMRETLRDALEGLPIQPYEKWLLQWPAQSILLTAALAWCRDVTALYKRGPPFSSSLQKLDGALTAQLLCVVDMIQKQRLSPLQRSVLENVIIGKVYHQDVLARLRESRVESVEDIEWLRVMRFYMEGEVVVRCGYSDLAYGLEYLGNSARLVITPLTERAFSSLITAVHLHYGGAPEGPAGTGKTETVKELARGVAKQCIVFNTTEQLDVSHMTRLLMGIASTGAWSCFDEFNRMDMEVLSVVAKQIMTIQSALASGERLFMFEGRNLSINRSLAIFITMNPMYEFRNVLPSNLKALFRPVAMMIPDYKLIAEVSLYAAGFQAASVLASHLVSVLKVASHRLSNEAHYDFAMRTLKSVLLIAAQLHTTEEGVLTSDEEASLVRIALLRCNMSKLKPVDAQIFLGVVDREFPQFGSADKYLGDLKELVIEAAKDGNVHATDDLVNRCLQTYSMLQIRTGVMLLGPAACGKSTVVSVLAAALTEMDARQFPPLPPVSLVTIFPKAVSAMRLYGQYNTSTQSWEDGVLTKALRNENGYHAANRAWVVLDGPVDHVWVEALNPVLDDNRTLCLSSGETLPLRDGISMIMEMDSIATASPATVSRCGMVYMAAPHFKLWHHMIRAWCAKLPPTLMEFAHKLEVTVTMLFTELAKAYTEAMEPDSPLPRQQPTSVLASMFRIMDALLPTVAQKVYHGLEGKPADACIEATALYSVVWAFEASLPQKARAFFNILVRQMSARTISYTKTKYGETTEHSAMGFQVSMPPDGQVFDFMFDYDNIRWVRWKEHVDALLDPQSIANMGPNAFMPFGLANVMGQANAAVRDCIVTADNLPALYLMRMLLGSRSNILLMGPTGTGKTALVQALIQSADNWMKAANNEELGHPGDGDHQTKTDGITRQAPQLAQQAQQVQRILHSDTLNKSMGQAFGEGSEQQSAGKSPFVPMSINLSSQSTASNTCRIIESYLLKRRRGVLGPPVGKIALMFVDDMSTAGRDMHGTQSALELLRQWCSIGGWHDERKATFKTVADTQLVGCTTVNPLKKSIPDRLLQYMSLVALPPISHAGFTLIFTAVLKRYMQPMTTVSSDLLPALVSATMELYRQVTATLLPVPSRPHYLFSIRHVGAVFKSMFHAHRSSRSTAFQLVKLWQHECSRVFQDRIVDPKEREWFADTLAEASSKHLSEFADTGRPDPRDVTFCTFASFGGQHYEMAEFVLRPDYAPITPPEQSPDPSKPGSPQRMTPSGSPQPPSRGGPHGQQRGSPSPAGGLTWEQQQLQERVNKTRGKQKDCQATSDKGSRPSTATRSMPSSPATGLGKEESEFMPPAPGNRLQEIYREGWIDDGILSKEEAIHERLKVITEYHAEEFLAQTTGKAAATVAGDSKQSGKAADKSSSPPVGGDGIVDRVAAIVVHRTALMHIARITRVLSMEQGHMILVGPPGSGRRTLARLSCHMSNVQVFEANLKDTQRGINWRDTLKTVMHVAGVLGRPVNLLLVDVGRAAEAMLDDSVHLMCSAHLPGLFKQEELQSIIKSLKPVARAAGVQWSEIDRTGASDNVLFEFFVDRCRANLHVILLLEANDAALQRVIVAFPKLFHLATLNLVDDWDDDACSQVSERVLESPEALCLDPSVFVMAIQSCVAMHAIAQKLCLTFNTKAGGQSLYHVTAYQYLQLLLRIREQLPKRRAMLSSDNEKYLDGVEKMVSMTDRLTKLQDEIAAMQPRLQDRKAETSQLMGMIHEEQSEAEAALAAIVPEEEQAKAAADRKAVLVAECEAELNKVMPPLLKVLKELRNIDKSSIAELKVMKSPPAGVKLVMRAICIMLGRVPEVLQGSRTKDHELVVQAYWDESIHVLSDFHFLDNLLSYDKDSIGPEVAAQIDNFVHDPSFNPTVVARSSKSAAVLGKWVMAIDAYQHVKKIVDPKREALQRAEQEFKAQESRLHEAQEHLATINKKIKEFEAKYARANAAKEALVADLDAAQAKVTQAQRVLNVVKKEVDRWKRSGEESELKHKQVLGEALLASGYIAYMGPLPGSYRDQAESEWSKALKSVGVLLSPSFSLAAFGGDTLTLEHWRDVGLPQSKNAVENALIMQQAPQWKLLIDPQEVGNSFLRGFYSAQEAAASVRSSQAGSAPSRPFMTANQSNPGFKEDLMRAIETGAVLLLENLDEDMDDMIEQLLQQITFHNQRGEMCIKLGDASAVYNPRFQLYVTTRLSNPHFPSNILRHLCVINFSITKLQLQELLITTTLKHEMPDLEQEHGLLIKQKAKNITEIMVLEEKVLNAINVTSTEALLEESDVFNMLVALQSAANDVKAKVQSIEASQNKINQVRQTMDKFLASKVVVFFFSLMDMSHIRHIYQFSLKWFLSLFKDSLHTCPRSNAGQDRLNSLSLHFTNLLYTNVSRSLFDEDKLPFAVLLLTRFTQASGFCTKEEANLLLFGRPDPGKGSLARISEGSTANKPLIIPPPPTAAPAAPAPQQQKPGQQPEQQQAGKEPDAFGGMFHGSDTAAASRRQNLAQGRQTLPPIESPSTSGSKAGDTQAQSSALSGQASSQKASGAAKKPGGVAGLQLGSNIPDFMELSAPAVLPQEMCPSWMPEDSWLRLKDLGKTYPYNKVLPEIFSDPLAKDALYKYYVDLTIPAAHDLPEPPHNRIANLTPFQRLLFIRCLQPRALMPAAKWAVRHVLGPACTVAEPVDLETAFPMSVATMPIVLISSTDQPLPQLMLFAEQRGMKVHHMAIGRGQGASADKLIRNSVRDACWVVLENTHLAGDYMPQLCSLVQALPTMSPHWDFRLWLTTVPSEEFPGIILQMALKLVMDPPAGLQANLVSVMSALPRDIMARVGATALPEQDDELSTYSTNPGMVAPGTNKPPSPVPQLSRNVSRAQSADLATKGPRAVGLEWKMLVLRLCLFHAILLERRHFKSLGFRRPYDFSAADFLSTIKQVRQVHKELMSSAAALAPGGDLEAVNRALPGLLYVDGQCLYGGKVSQDWDRRLLVSLLQQQLMPGCALNPCGDVTLPNVDMLMPTLPKLLTTGIQSEPFQLENAIKEVRSLELDQANPTLVGLTAGASVVRQSQQTRHSLNFLKRVQLMQSNDTEAGASQPLQVALSMAQDLTRQLPFTVLPTVVSAWVAMIQGKVPHTPAPLRPAPSSQQPQQPQQQHSRHSVGGGVGEGGTSAPHEASSTQRTGPKRSVTMAPQAGGGAHTQEAGATDHAPPHSTAGTAGGANGGAGAAEGGAPAQPAAVGGALGAYAAMRKERPKPIGSARPVNRARQLKMTEAISEPALARWEGMGEYERQMMVQVFEAEVLCYQLVLNTVHGSLKMVMSAIKGFDPVRGEFQELIKQLSSNEVPTQWLDAVPGLNLNAEGIGTWISDLQDRLAFIYRWACEGPPVVMPLGMLAKPKAYLTSVQQIHAEKQNKAVGSLMLRCCILDQPEELSRRAAKMSPEEMDEVEVCTNEGGSLSLLKCWQHGCLISGVTLQGAHWDGEQRCLAEPASTSIFCPMPLLWLVPMRQKEPVKCSHWRTIRESLNLDEGGGAHEDLEGLITGRTRSKRRTGMEAPARSRRSTVTADFGREQELEELGGKPQPRMSMPGGILEPQQQQQQQQQSDGTPAVIQGGKDGGGQGGERDLKRRPTVADGDLWGLDKGPSSLLQERYTCPVYLYTHTFGGRVSNRSSDVDDCLFELHIPSGLYSPMHWITRNVVILIAPTSLVE